MVTDGTVETYEFTPDSEEVHCFNLTAIDDGDIESIEYHEIILRTIKQLDIIDTQVTIVIITDNDGKINDYCRCKCTSVSRSLAQVKIKFCEACMVDCLYSAANKCSVEEKRLGQGNLYTLGHVHL